MLNTKALYTGLFDNVYFDAPDQPVTPGVTYATYTSSNDSLVIRSIGLDASGNIIMSWPGNAILESAPEATGPWTNVVGATNPFKVVPVGSRAFYRLRQ
jgi:hypothetical protein